MSSFIAPGTRRFANFSALLDYSPTIILEGCILSYSDFPSLKNYDENIMLSISNISLVFSVYPTGTVDFITFVASGSIDNTFAITASTLLVLK